MCKAKAIRKSHPYWRHAMQKYLSSIQLNRKKFNWMIFVVYTKENSKTMKKSKIIVPALGLLLLSTAASVSGTVAWFTANRTFSTDAGNFAVVKTTTDLVCVMAGGVGTKVNNNSTATNYSDDKIELNETASTVIEMTDASFDHDTSNVIVPDADGAKVGSLISLSSATLATDLVRATYDDAESKTHTVYSALTWEMDFQVSYTAAGTNSGLFFDLSKTTFTQPDGTALAEAGKGFRLAFIPATGSNDTNHTYLTGNKRVLARAQSSAETWDHDADAETAAVNKVRYIDNASVGDNLNSAAAAYSAPILIDSTATYTIPNDNVASTASLASVPAYLGKFVAEASKTVHLKFTVVAWYEGTDPLVVNSSALLEKVKAKLAFELRTLTD